MRRRLKLSLALLASVVLSLLGWQPAARAQTRARLVADTGIVWLGPNQVLRLAVVSTSRRDDVTVRFRRLEYAQGECDQGVCAHSIASQAVTDPVTLTPGQGASIDISAGSSGARAMVVSFQDVLVSSLRVTGEIRDATTGQIIAILIGL